MLIFYEPPVSAEQVRVIEPQAIYQFVMTSGGTTIILEDCYMEEVSGIYEVLLSGGFTGVMKNPGRPLTQGFYVQIGAEGREVFTVNIKVVDQGGAPIQGAAVSCYDQADTQVWSVTTGAEGTIAEQEIMTRKWLVTDSPEAKYPHRIVVSKPGYRTVEIKEIAATEPIVWTVELKAADHPPQAWLDVR